MIRRGKARWKTRITAGQCPFCRWWFDGYLVGAVERITKLNELVEWSVDARHTGRCLKNQCRIDNRYERPALEVPRDPRKT